MVLKYVIFENDLYFSKKQLLDLIEFLRMKKADSGEIKEFVRKIESEISFCSRSHASTPVRVVEAPNKEPKS